MPCSNSLVQFELKNNANGRKIEGFCRHSIYCVDINDLLVGDTAFELPEGFCSSFCPNRLRFSSRFPWNSSRTQKRVLCGSSELMTAESQGLGRLATRVDLQLASVVPRTRLNDGRWRDNQPDGQFGAGQKTGPIPAGQPSHRQTQNLSLSNYIIV